MSIHWTNLDTAGKIEAIRSVYEPGLTVQAIGARIPGATRGAVTGVYKRCRDSLKDCPLKPANSPLDWTDEEKQLLAGYLRDGLSARQIAPLVGKSRNAIIGVVSRDKMLMEIGFRRKSGFQLKGQTAIKRLPPGNTLRRSPTRRISFVCESVEPSRNLTLMDLQPKDCRWPTNDAGPGELHLFCGHPKKPGDVSYCHGHRRLSCGPGTESERVAHKVLIKQAVTA